MLRRLSAAELYRIARCCNEDCVLDGVQFKKGALVFLLVDSIHHDPNIWTDPEVFNPERYYQSVIPTTQTLCYVTHLLHANFFLVA